eukprot:Ihof_evm5s431 gene=Ihof_evmTU5s431
MTAEKTIISSLVLTSNQSDNFSDVELGPLVGLESQCALCRTPQLGEVLVPVCNCQCCKKIMVHPVCLSKHQRMTGNACVNNCGCTIEPRPKLRPRSFTRTMKFSPRNNQRTNEILRETHDSNSITLGSPGIRPYVGFGGSTPPTPTTTAPTTITTTTIGHVDGDSSSNRGRETVLTRGIGQISLSGQSPSEDPRVLRQMHSAPVNGRPHSTGSSYFTTSQRLSQRRRAATTAARRLLNGPVTVRQSDGSISDNANAMYSTDSLTGLACPNDNLSALSFNFPHDQLSASSLANPPSQSSLVDCLSTLTSSSVLSLSCSTSNSNTDTSTNTTPRPVKNLDASNPVNEYNHSPVYHSRVMCNYDTETNQTNLEHNQNMKLINNYTSNGKDSRAYSSMKHGERGRRRKGRPASEARESASHEDLKRLNWGGERYKYIQRSHSQNDTRLREIVSSEPLELDDTASRRDVLQSFTCSQLKMQCHEYEKALAVWSIELIRLLQVQDGLKKECDRLRIVSHK